MEMEIDTKALLYNIDQIEKESKTSVCAVVKCNAYGHGDLLCARAVCNRVGFFAVADTAEALRLASGGITRDILILSDNYDGRKYPPNFIFTAYDRRSLKNLMNSGRRFAVKTDTGMNRLGLSCREFAQAAEFMDFSNIHSVYSHIYDSSSIESQYSVFVALTSGLPVKKHLFASNFSLSNYDHLDYVRCGLALYGYGAENLKPVMKVRAAVLRIHRVNAGENIGYGINLVNENCNVATVNVGYGDGFRRKKAGEKRSVIISGEKCEVLGQICMDMMMVKVPDRILPGDKVDIIGELFNADDIAEEWGTNTYDVLVSLGNACPARKYLK